MVLIQSIRYSLESRLKKRTEPKQTTNTSVKYCTTNKKRRRGRGKKERNHKTVRISLQELTRTRFDNYTSNRILSRSTSIDGGMGRPNDDDVGGGGEINVRYFGVDKSPGLGFVG